MHARAHHRPGQRRLARIVGVLAGAAIAVSTGWSVGSAPAAGTAETGCGTIPRGALKDPSRLVSTLPPAVRANYYGMPERVLPSALADVRPRHPAPWKIGLLLNPIANPYNALLLKDMKAWVGKVKSKKLVRELVAYAIPTFDVAAQIHQFRSLIQQRVDLIMVEPASGPALVPLAEAAHKAGIPVVSFFGVVDSPYAVNLTVNPYLNSAEPMAYVVKNALHGTGNVLIVRGAPTQPTDVAGYSGVKAVLSRCPGIKVVGSVVGGFINAVAKSEVLKFLASHPGEIHGVYDGGTMAQGVISAFQQLGRPLPAVTNLGGQQGPLSFWLKNERTFHSAGTAIGTTNGTRAWLNIALRILEGKGPKMNNIILRAPLITDANLPQWTSESHPFDDLSSAQGPPDSLAPNSLLDNWFAKPGSGAPGIL
jgi:ribose transport system substrate-binding protein